MLFQTSKKFEKQSNSRIFYNQKHAHVKDTLFDYTHKAIL